MGVITLLTPIHIYSTSITRGLAIYIKKYLKAKEEELWKFKYFTLQKYNLQKKILQNPSRYHNSITNLKFQHKLRYHLSRILI
jgi:uncharacterized HAD superfamily protein